MVDNLLAQLVIKEYLCSTECILIFGDLLLLLYGRGSDVLSFDFLLDYENGRVIDNRMALKWNS